LNVEVIFPGRLPPDESCRSKTFRSILCIVLPDVFPYNTWTISISQWFLNEKMEKFGFLFVMFKELTIKANMCLFFKTHAD